MNERVKELRLEFGSKLKDFRKRIGYDTVYKISDMTGVTPFSQTQIADWEQGRRTPTVGNIRILSEALLLKVDEERELIMLAKEIGKARRIKNGNE